MAHPKLSTVINRSLLAASTAALIAGPLATIGTAQSLETLPDDIVDLTCDEAKETEDLELIMEFCEEDELSGPLAKAVDEARAKLEQEAEREAKNAKATVEETTGVKAPVDPTGGGGGDDGGGDSGESNPDPAPAPAAVVPADRPDEKPQTGSRKVRNQGEQPRGISSGVRGESAKTTHADGYGASSYSGMQSNSALTLQPFAAPLVSVPPVYELPQVAQQLFGLDSATTDGSAVAMADGTTTAASAYSDYTATPADASGWLAATATGLIMLLGAAHALNGARTPKRKRA